MGKRTEEEKTPLAEFLYRDNELISSLYSQLFGGDLDSVTSSKSSSEESSMGYSLGSKNVINSNGISKDANINQLSKNITPKDDKVLELLDNINVISNNIDFKKLRNGSLVRIEGNLSFNNFDLFKDMFYLLNDMGELPDLFSYARLKNGSKNGGKNGGKNGVKHNNKCLIDLVDKMTPSGIEFELVTNNNEHIVCCIDNNYLSNNINLISKNYRCKHLGAWIVYGIIDSFTDENSEVNDNDIFSVIDSVGKDMIKIIKPNFSLFLRPIAIYRQLHY